MLAKISKTCPDQATTSTASEIAVFTARQDLYQGRARPVLDFERGNIRRNSPRGCQKKRIRDRELYYKKLMPLLHVRFFGILGFLRVSLTKTIDLSRPIMHGVSGDGICVVIHKSCTLAAQTFMIAMVSEGYNTCPSEGFDSKQTKKLLKLPYGAEMNMVIGCGT